MSHPEISRFNTSGDHEENNPQGADSARRRIAALPNLYLSHASPSKSDLIGEVVPSSPAAEQQPGGLSALTQAASSAKLHITSTRQTGSPAVDTSSQVEPQPQPPEPAAAPQPVAKKHPGSFKRLRPVLTGALTLVSLFALIMVVFRAPVILSQIGYSGPNTSDPVEQAPAAAQVSPDPVISIPKINVSAPIVFADNNAEAAIQKDLESGVVHYAHTALPGEPGNSVIFGHSSNDWWEPGNYKFVFVLLDKLVVGDTFTVNYDSRRYTYQVTDTKVVEPTDLSVLNATSEYETTLITCTPPGTSWKRLVVRAKQIDPAPQTTAGAASQALPEEAGSLPGNSPGLTEQIGNWWENIVQVFR